jgi:sulfur carrier protein ThiS
MYFFVESPKSYRTNLENRTAIAPMTITIQASGILKEQIPTELEIEASTVGEAVSQYDLSAAGEVLLLVNGRLAHWNTVLNEGDVLKLVPAIGGGARSRRLRFTADFPGLPGLPRISN